MERTTSSQAWFYKDLLPFSSKHLQPYKARLRSFLQPHIAPLDLQNIVLEYSRHHFEGQKRSTLNVGKASRYLAMTAVGDTLFVADGDNHINAFEYMSTEEWQRTGFWIAGSMITQLGAYGQHLLSSDYNGEVSVWNPSNGELVRKLTGHTGRVLAFAEVGALLATCSFDKTVRLWSLSQTEQVDQIAFQSLPIGMVAWDGKLAVADSRADTQIFACEEGVWACIWTLKVPGQLTSLALSPCNDLLSVVDRFVYSAHSHKGPLRKLIGYDRLDKCVCAVDDTLAVGYSDKSMPRTALYTNDGRCLGIIFTESVRGMVAIGGRLAVATAGGLVTFVD